MEPVLVRLVTRQQLTDAPTVLPSHTLVLELAAVLSLRDGYLHVTEEKLGVQRS